MKLITCSVALFLSLTSFNTLAANVWNSPDLITKVQVIHHGGFIVYFENVFNTTCSGDGNRSYVYSGQNGVTDDGVKALLSTALLALSTGIPASVKYDDTNSNCWVQYLKLER